MDLSFPALDCVHAENDHGEEAGKEKDVEMELTVSFSSGKG